MSVRVIGPPINVPNSVYLCRYPQSVSTKAAVTTQATGYIFLQVGLSAASPWARLRRSYIGVVGHFEALVTVSTSAVHRLPRPAVLTTCGRPCQNDPPFWTCIHPGTSQAREFRSKSLRSTN